MLPALLLASVCMQAPTRDRYDFAERCQKLQTGMTEAQVRSIIGKPDEVTSEAVDLADGWTAENYWRYGVVRPGGMASYGTLHFQQGKLSQFEPPTLPSPGLLQESELEQILQTIDDGARQGSMWQPDSSGPPSFNPLTIVRADNALIALGRKQGILVLREYLRASYPNNRPSEFYAKGAFAIVQTIFEAPVGGSVPGPAIGYYGPPPAESKFPYWPLTLSGDVFYSPGAGGAGTGVPERVDCYLDRLERKFKFRRRLLEPSSTPWEVDGLSPRSGNEPNYMDDIRRRRIRWEVLNLVATAYRHDFEYKYSDPDFVLSFDEALWKRQVAGMKAAGIHWDWQRQMYVRGDGSTIAKVKTYGIAPETLLATEGARARRGIRDAVPRRRSKGPG